ncbi:MAG: hypothetical protein S4CHLAM45_03940 [Chlamydiales bacterium]|nr:hypothetical protein [Chlamydiales bacterium]MCH9619248.1 hypothetical protein [Chlamydiales bacterium]MCH9622510.1 hypothetical protein [Chlamydiales bacterium]
MNIAKLIKLPLLIDASEMEALLNLLPFAIYNVQGIVPKGEEKISKETFLQMYTDYLDGLKGGDEKVPHFAPAFSVTEEAFTFLPAKERVLVKPKLPVVQLRPYTIDSNFRSMLYGTDVISWGIEISYPSLFHHPETYQVEKVDSRFPNTKLFTTVRKWVRDATCATPFLVEGKRKNIPIRLGKECFSWIQTHPGLKRRGIEVAC